MLQPHAMEEVYDPNLETLLDHLLECDIAIEMGNVGKQLLSVRHIAIRPKKDTEQAHTKAERENEKIT